MVTLVIPPKENVGKTMSFLNAQYAEAANIKSKATMTSVQGAITSTRERLKLWKNTPENGLIIFCGQVLMPDGKTEKKMTIDLVPFKPPLSFLYDASNRFQTQALNYMLEDDEKFGFIIVDGNGVLFATL